MAGGYRFPDQTGLGVAEAGAGVAERVAVAEIRNGRFERSSGALAHSCSRALIPSQNGGAYEESVWKESKRGMGILLRHSLRKLVRENSLERRLILNKERRVSEELKREID